MKGVLAYFAKDLSFGTIVLVKIDFGSITSGALAVVRDVTFTTPPDRLYGLVIVLIPPLEVLHEVTIIPGFYMEYQWEFIHFELLVLRRMGVIKSPLLEWDVLTDKIYQPDILLIKILNDLK